MNPQNVKPYDENEIIDIDPASEYEDDSYPVVGDDEDAI